MKKNAGWISLVLILLLSSAVLGARGRPERTPGRPVRPASPRAAAAAAAKEEKEEKEDIIEMHGVDKLETLLRFVDKMTDKVVVYDSSIRATKVKIFGTARIPKKDLLKFVETILAMNGATMVEAPGNILRVVPAREVTEPVQLYVGDEALPNSSATVTKVIKLEYANTGQVNTLVRGLITPQTGKVVIYDNLSMLFVTDSAYKLRKVMQIIQMIDVPAPKVQLETIQVKNAPVGEMARTLDTLMQRKAARERTGKKTIERAYIVADERSSSLIVLGLPEEIEEVRKVKDSLDLPVEEIGGMFHHYQLKNTSAADLAKVLVDLYQRKAVAERTRTPGAKPTPQQQQPSIVPEPNTNSLLIIAPPDVYKEMEALIAKLDVRRPQVLIEAMLVELTVDNTQDLGFEFVTGDKPKEGTDTIVAGTGFGFSTLEFDEEFRPIRVPLLGTGLTAGMFHDENHIPVLLRAWETAGDVEVLAVPRVLTNDNADATISIGDEVPYQRTTVQNDIRDITWATATAMMELKITPHISEAAHLRLDLGFKLERFGAQPDLTAPPPKSTRNATMKITVPDKSSVVVGGLTHTTMTDSETRVPLLHRIPILGHLFKRSTKVRRKSHLFLFITPRILRPIEGEDEFSNLKDISDTVEKKVKELKKKKEWKREEETWGGEDRPEKESTPVEAPEVEPLPAETKIDEERIEGTVAAREGRTETRRTNDAGESKDPFKTRRQGDRRER